MSCPKAWAFGFEFLQKTKHAATRRKSMKRAPAHTQNNAAGLFGSCMIWPEPLAKPSWQIQKPNA